MWSRLILPWQQTCEINYDERTGHNNQNANSYKKYADGESTLNHLQLSFTSCS